jgi:hypothetical protein
VFGVAAYNGAELICFMGLADRVVAAVAVPPKQTGSSVRDLKPLVSSWLNVTGFTTWARSLWLNIVLSEKPGDIKSIEKALTGLAETSPTSFATWQALVEARAARGAPQETVLAAFRMSALTGSHEGSYMMKRVIFGLEHWSELTEPNRQLVVRELLATLVSGDAVPRYRGILAGKAGRERDEIRAALETSGLASRQLLTALGV